jgi:apolipoprotein N-acyltransferase
MDSRPDHAFAAAPCLAISAALFFLSTGLAPLWPLTWLAPIPVLWAASRLSARQAFCVAAAAYALGFLNEWSYLRTVLSTWLVISFLVLSACLFAVDVVLFRMGVVRGKLWRAALVFPAFWASVEFAIAMLSIHGTFFNISYSQMNSADCFSGGHLGHQFHDFSVCLDGCCAARPRSSLGEASVADRQRRFYCGCVSLWCVAARVDAQFADL